MGRIYILMILLATLLLPACSGKKQSGAEVPIVELKGTVVFEPEDYFHGFMCMVSGDTIMEVSAHSDSMFTMLSISGDSLKIIDRFGSYGSGPDEMIDGKIAKTPDGGYVILDVPSGTRIFSIPAGAEHDRSKWSHVSMDTMQMLGSQFVALNDSVMLIASAPFKSEGSIFSIIDFKNGKYEPTGFWPDDGYDGPSTPKNILYSSNATMQSRGDGRYFYSALARRYAIIFTIDGTTVNIAETLIDDPVNFKPQDNGMMPSVHTGGAPHIIRPVANASHIYMLHCRKAADGTVAEKFQDLRGGNEVEVFDWDGNLVRRYELDRLGYNIYVNQGDKDLYLYTENPESGAYEWIRYRMEN